MKTTAAVDVLSYRLKKQGFMTASAETGREAVAMIQKDPPDLILLEPRLPDIDGFELCEHLTDSSETCLIPIVQISGWHNPDIVRQSRKSGARYFIHKPYDPDILLLVIQHLLRSREEAMVLEEMGRRFKTNLFFLSFPENGSLKRKPTLVYNTSLRGWSVGRFLSLQGAVIYLVAIRTKHTIPYRLRCNLQNNILGTAAAAITNPSDILFGGIPWERNNSGKGRRKIGRKKRRMRSKIRHRK